MMKKDDLEMPDTLENDVTIVVVEDNLPVDKDIVTTKPGSVDEVIDLHDIVAIHRYHTMCYKVLPLLCTWPGSAGGCHSLLAGGRSPPAWAELPD